MYEDFYGMQDKPFSIVPNPAMVYGSKRHKQGLTYLNYALADDIGFVLFTGGIGTGKTTLLRRFLTETSPNIDIANVFNTNVSGLELLQFILREYEIEPVPDNKVECISALNDYCIENFAKGRRTLLIIDEAQNLSREALEEVRLLSNLQSQNQSLLQIILCGQPELKEIVHAPGLEQLAQRIAVRYHLTPLNREETGEYIRFRLEAAKAKNLDLFTEEALDLIFENTSGIPRAINILCNTALVYGFADELPQITAEVVKQVIEENGGALEVTQSAARMDAWAGPAPSANDAGASAGDPSASPRWEYVGYAQQIASLQNEVKRISDRLTWLETNPVIPDEGNDKMMKALTTLVDKERTRYEQLQRHTVKLEQEILGLRKRLSTLDSDTAKR